MKVTIEDLNVGETITISCNETSSQEIDCELIKKSMENGLNHLPIEVGQRSLGRLLQPEQNEQ